MYFQPISPRRTTDSRARRFWTPILVFALVVSLTAEAQITDRNGDGSVAMAAFGDSITFGIGDAVGGGYPLRLQTLLGVPVSNGGVPGETLTVEGISRFASFTQASSADYVLILEGANDAVFRTDAAAYERALQQAINVVVAQGKEAVAMTLPPPCCDRSSLAPYTSSYSGVVRDLASLNDLLLVDLERAWNSTCPVPESCVLYNLPEGLHPSASGYDAVSHSISASLLGIDIFAADGAASLESALGLLPGSVIVKPDGEVQP